MDTVNREFKALNHFRTNTDDHHLRIIIDTEGA